MTATEYVILVDENDNEIGKAEKLFAHQKCLCHRAFSVFIFRKKPKLQLLLQKRAQTKYHCPGLWSNACCSHPRAGEEITAAGERRLFEELGLKTPLKRVASFHYIAHFDNGLSENEIDHVLIGLLPENVQIFPNSSEVEAYEWLSIEEIQEALLKNPEHYTPWLAESLDLAIKHFSF